MKNLFIILLVFAVNQTLALANKAQPISLQFDISRGGVEVCKDTKLVTDGDTFLVCDGKSLGNRNILKVKASILPKKSREGFVENKNQIKISAIMEEVDSSGRIVTIGSPQIIAFEGEAASISMSEADNSGKEINSLSMTVTAKIK